MLHRHALTDLDPNAISSLLASPRKGISENSLEKPRVPTGSTHQTSQVDHGDYVKVCKERDTLVEEVRKLTRELNKAEPEQSTSSWQKITASTREMRRLEDEMRDLKDQLSNEKDRCKVHEDMISGFEKEKCRMQSAIAEAKTELSTTKDMTSNLLLSLETSKKCASQAGAEIDSLKARHAIEVESLNEIIDQLKSECLELAIKLEENTAVNNNYVGESGSDVIAANVDHVVVAELQSKLANSEQIRRKLQNQVHELRGNVRVFVRCRPFLQGDEEFDQLASTSNSDSSAVSCCEEANVISLAASRGATVGGALTGPCQTFSFDQVFKDSSSQDQVFDAVSDLIQSALDGYRVCVFCYGQTGSGKTHTMTGSTGGDASGIIPRAVDKVVQEVISMRKSGWQITLKASMLEVYNETVKDILTSPFDDLGSIETNSSENKHSSKHRVTFANGRVSVSDVGHFEIDTSTLETGRACLADILQRSQKNRTTACTAMNERSSRSHCLFYLDISGYHAGVNAFMEGGLRLVDLAGSERLGRAGTAGDASRFRETVSINKSLSSLGEVFLALGNKSAHVPYRNSKLTMLLQDCLSGDGKALMFVNISPTVASLQETVCSLRFANQVNQVELGQAKKSVFKNPFLPPPPAAAPVPERVISRTRQPETIAPHSERSIVSASLCSNHTRALKEDDVVDNHDSSFGEMDEFNHLDSISFKPKACSSHNSRSSIMHGFKRTSSALTATTVSAIASSMAPAAKRKKTISSKTSSWR